MKVFQSHHLWKGNYDSMKQELTIHFVNGSSKTYIMVPRQAAEKLMEASSPGTYFHKMIKGVYPEKKNANV